MVFWFTILNKILFLRLRGNTKIHAVKTVYLGGIEQVTSGKRSRMYLNMTHVYLLIYLRDEMYTIYHMKRDKFYPFRKYPQHRINCTLPVHIL